MTLAISLTIEKKCFKIMLRKQNYDLYHLLYITFFNFIFKLLYASFLF